MRGYTELSKYTREEFIKELKESVKTNVYSDSLKEIIKTLKHRGMSGKEPNICVCIPQTPLAGFTVDLIDKTIVVTSHGRSEPPVIIDVRRLFDSLTTKMLCGMLKNALLGTHDKSRKSAFTPTIDPWAESERCRNVKDEETKMDIRKLLDKHDKNEFISMLKESLVSKRMPTELSEFITALYHHKADHRTIELHISQKGGKGGFDISLTGDCLKIQDSQLPSESIVMDIKALRILLDLRSIDDDEAEGVVMIQTTDKESVEGTALLDILEEVLCGQRPFIPLEELKTRANITAHDIGDRIILPYLDKAVSLNQNVKTIGLRVGEVIDAMVAFRMVPYELSLDDYTDETIASFHRKGVTLFKEENMSGEVSFVVTCTSDRERVTYRDIDPTDRELFSSLRLI